jgi:hypothetical protein
MSNEGSGRFVWYDLMTGDPQGALFALHSSG